MTDLLYLLVGLIMGVICTWLIAYYFYLTKLNGTSPEEIKERFVLKELYNHLQIQNDVQRDDLLDKEQEIRNIGSQLSAAKQQVADLENRLNSQKADLINLETRFQKEFENVANRLLEEKSQRFAAQNQQQLTNILQPLREKIREFEQGIEQKYLDETKERSSLKKEIEQLRDLNVQLSKDAHNLVNALKGDNKAQGDWGEFRLELILERAGLSKNIHYLVQESYTDNLGQQKRPDFIIQLPDQKHLIIDSKVSLRAYEQFFNESDENNRKRHLKAHVDSLRNHIRDLSSKNYTMLYQINSPDYLMLFVPIEPALSLALQEDPQLFNEALDKNIVIVTTSTLLATMRTVSFIWRQEKQKSNVIEIARQSGLLYDKFVTFVEDLKSVGNRLDMARNAYDDAMHKLADGKRYGDTLIGKAEKIKELGAKTNKQLPQEFLQLPENED